MVPFLNTTVPENLYKQEIRISGTGRREEQEAIYTMNGMCIALVLHRGYRFDAWR